MNSLSSLQNMLRCELLIVLMAAEPLSPESPDISLAVLVDTVSY